MCRLLSIVFFVTTMACYYLNKRQYLHFQIYCPLLIHEPLFIFPQDCILLCWIKISYVNTYLSSGVSDHNGILNKHMPLKRSLKGLLSSCYQIYYVHLYSTNNIIKFSQSLMHLGQANNAEGKRPDNPRSAFFFLHPVSLRGKFSQTCAGLGHRSQSLKGRVPPIGAQPKSSPLLRHLSFHSASSHRHAGIKLLHVYSPYVFTHTHTVLAQIITSQSLRLTSRTVLDAYAQNKQCPLRQ